VIVARVFLHRSCRLRALTAEAQVELTDALDVSAVLTSQDYAFRSRLSFGDQKTLYSVPTTEGGNLPPIPK
jgi:hypothetical protein